jgi:hypothetical protein
VKRQENKTNFERGNARAQIHYQVPIIVHEENTSRKRQKKQSRNTSGKKKRRPTQHRSSTEASAHLLERHAKKPNPERLEPRA